MRDDGDGGVPTTTASRRKSPKDARPTRPRADGGMRIVVPLQGVVQGRGGLVLGSLIPCALFYFLQLYIKRNRPPAPQPPGSPPPPPSATPIHRSHSRGLLTPRAALPALSARGAVVRSGDEDSLYYAGLRRCADDPYHPAANPDGIINLGIAENHVRHESFPFLSFRPAARSLFGGIDGWPRARAFLQMSLDLVGRWLEDHAAAAMLDGIAGAGEDVKDLTIRGLATYQPYDGILALKMVG